MVSPEASIAATFGAPDDELITGEAVALNVRPTGFVLRAAGAAIDMILYFGVWFGIVMALSGPLVGGLLSEAMFKAIIVGALVLCIVILPMTVELATRGRSLGKLAVGARIVRDDGGAIGFRHSFIRAMTGVLEIFATFGGFAAVIALVNSKAKRLGDLMAGTYSQNERITRYTPPVYGVPLELVQWAHTADVAKMPDRVARRISQFLSAAGGFTPQSRVAVAHTLAVEAAPYVSPIPQADPELFLAAISTIRREREFAALQSEKDRIAALAPALDRLPRGFPAR